MKQYVIAGLLALAANAAHSAAFDLGTLVPQETETVFNLFGGALEDAYHFTVNDPFALTGIVNAYDVSNFSFSISNAGGELFQQDVLIAAIPVSGFSNGFMANLTEKTLNAGTYVLNIEAESTSGRSAYAGSITVGRPDTVMAARVAAVPEPSTYAMLIAGLALLAFSRRYV